MATLNLGRIKPVFRGAYSGSTAYVVDDIVTHGNESFICIQAHGAGTQATSVTAYWTKLAAKGADGTDVGTTITTQGDILYRDGSGLQRLAKGTASQQLAMNSGATAPEWITASSGGLLQVKQTVLVTTPSVSGSSGNFADITGFSVDITPASASNKVLVIADIRAYTGTNGYAVVTRLMRDSTAIYINTNQQSNQASATHGHISNGTAGLEGTKVFLDNPATTSATTYKIQWFSETGATAYLNRTGSDSNSSYYWRDVSSITAMEIASGAL